MNLETRLFGTVFQNPVLLAAGTCGFGRELADVLDLERLGGFVTKSVTPERRTGNPAPRVAELAGAMLNSIGLANPGLAGVRADKLPWIRDSIVCPKVFVSVAGHAPDHYAEVVGGLEEEEGFLGFELNLSCPNDAKLGGLPFALDPAAVEQVIALVRPITGRPLLVKLAPNDPRIGATARIAEAAGADGVTLVNTLPGLGLETASGRPLLGAGPGGVSGPALQAVGVRAVREARTATALPIVGVGGISTADDAVQYLRAGASLVQIGTATFAAPRAALRVIDGLRRWGRAHRFKHVSELAPEVTIRFEAGEAGEGGFPGGYEDG